MAVHAQAAEMLLSKGLLSDGSLYISALPQASLSPRPASGGWQPAARSLNGSPGASGSLRTLLKQVCSLCSVCSVWCPLVFDLDLGI